MGSKKKKKYKGVATKREMPQGNDIHPVADAALALFASAIAATFAAGFVMILYQIVSYVPRYRGGNVERWWGYVGFQIVMSLIFLLFALACIFVSIYCIVQAFKKMR